MPFNPYMFNPRGFDPTQDYGITNPVAKLRQRSIFNQPTTPEDNTKRFLSQVNPAPKADFSQPESGSDQYDPARNYAEMKRLLTTKGPALSAYQSALQDQPTDQNVPVSTGRKVMGTLAGIAGGLARGPEGGISAANEIIDSPYKTAMRDYSVKMKNLGESARMEQDDRDAQIKLVDYADKSQLDYAKYGQTERQHLRDEEDKRLTRELTRGANESLDAYRKRQTDIAAEQARIAAARQKEDATYHAGQLNLGARNAAVGERGASTGEVNAKTNAGRLTEEQNYHKDLKEKGTKISPTQQRTAIQMTLEELYADPKNKPFIAMDKDRGIFSEQAPSQPSIYSAGANMQDYAIFQRKKAALLKSILEKSNPNPGIQDAPSSGGKFDWYKDE